MPTATRYQRMIARRDMARSGIYVLLPQIAAFGLMGRYGISMMLVMVGLALNEYAESGVVRDVPNFK